MEDALAPRGEEGRDNVITSYSIHYTKLYEARAPALHAGGQGFDSLILHMFFKIMEIGNTFFVWAGKF